MSVTKRLTKAKTDNYLLYGLSAFLFCTGTFGVYGTLTPTGDSIPFQQQPGRVPRSARQRRREELMYDSTANGIKKNYFITAN